MIVVLCRPSDVPASEGERKRWIDFFVPGGSDPSNIQSYLHDISNGAYDPGDVYVTDWLDIGHRQSDVAQYGGIAQRNVLAQWGRKAAGDDGIDVDAVSHIVFAYNINADHGSVGGGAAVLAYAESRPFEPTFMFHEVGHVLGLEHSRSDSGGEYDDRFDIMSAMSVWTFNDAWGRAAGPAAAAINLERLGWLDSDRIDYREVVTDQGLHELGYGDNFFINPLYRPNAVPDEPVIAVFSALGQAFYIEYRESTGWDLGFGTPRVLIHRSVDGVPVIIGGGNEPAGALALGQRLEMSDQPCPWGFAFNSIRGDSLAEVGFWVDYM